MPFNVILRSVEELTGLLTRRQRAAPLDVASLQLARIEFPQLRVDPFLRMLDALAENLGSRLRRPADGRDYVMAANHLLFEELAFRGNDADYYNPRNSCLNEVLTSRRGIPITLSIVYMEVARRLDRPVYGIALPGHFVVQYDDGAYSAYVDVFHRGVLLSEADCDELVKSITGAGIPDDASLRPAAGWQILTRMLNNLRGIYFHRRNFGKVAQVLDLLIAAQPDSAEEYKQRGVALVQLGRIRDAVEDFRRYVKLAPEAEDRGEIEAHVKALGRWLASMN